MHHHRQFIRFVQLGLVALLAGVAILCAAPDVMAAPGAQRTPGGGYVPRPVTIRRLPGGRILRIVSRAHGGMMNRICMPALLDAQGIGVREPTTGNEALAASVVFLPGSGQLAENLSVPVVCVLADDQPVTASALSPDGQTRLPALVVSEGRLSIVSLPIEAFTMPGVWQLDVSAPVSGVYTFTIPPVVQPTLIVSGEGLLLEGFKPGEALRGVVMANRCITEFAPLSDSKEVLPPLDKAELALCAKNEVSALLDAVQVFEAVADERGIAFVQRIDPLQDLTYVFLGAETPQLLSTITFSEDLDAAIADSGFPVDRETLFAGRDSVTDPLIDKTAPTPAVMPSTGASFTGFRGGIYGAGTALLLAGMLAVLASGGLYRVAQNAKRNQ